MKKIEIKGLDEVFYTDECENGLKIFVWVKTDVNHFNGTYVVKAGSEDISFQVGKKNYSVPPGTAHYLEHCLCDGLNSTNYLNRFSSLGSISNASTYWDWTMFEFVGTNHLEENLECLLDWTYQREFDSEQLERNRGPILEEFRMHLDNTSREGYHAVENAVFSNYPSKNYGTGNKEEIEEITLEDIENFYHAFYHPKNSFVVITGNVDPFKTIQMIKENQKNKTFPKWVEVKKAKYKEPKKVNIPLMEIDAKVKTPIVWVATKIPKKDFPFDEFLSMNIIQLILNANFGSTSLFKEELLASHYAMGISSWVDEHRDYFVIMIKGRTMYPEEFIQKVCEKLDSIEYLEDDILRKKKAVIANLVLSFENIDMVKDEFISEIAKYGHIVENVKEIMESIDKEKILAVLDHLSMKEKSVVVLKEKKSE